MNWNYTGQHELWVGDDGLMFDDYIVDGGQLPDEIAELMTQWAKYCNFKIKGYKQYQPKSPFTVVVALPNGDRPTTSCVYDKLTEAK
jgi:hypothetical protein